MVVGFVVVGFEWYVLIFEVVVFWNEFFGEFRIVDVLVDVVGDVF